MTSNDSYSHLPSAKSVLSAAASIAASAVLVRTVANDLLPPDFQDYLFSSLYRVFNRFSSQLTIVVEEFNGFSINQIYQAAETYLGTKISPSTRRLKVAQMEKEKNIKVTMDRDEEVVDVFEAIQIKWRFIYIEKEMTLSRRGYSYDRGLNSQTQVRYFELSFHKKHKEKVLGSYLPFVVEKSKTIKQELKEIKLHTLDYDNLYGNLADAWRSINLNHPATFETLAMDPELKREVMDDLKRFIDRKEFYRRVGKAWKRGYLLYGPPGTGKTSLIAAMANFLKFDIYDLELSDVQKNSELKTVLLATANRSILVVEDIDCSIDLQNRENEKPSKPRDDDEPLQPQMTLSGLLNFVDGLWSSCGDERIFIFTTNHKEKLDPALLRPGRMDLHIHMSYLNSGGFDVLASNYLGIQHHNLFKEIHRLIAEVEVTPAQVAEKLMNRDNPDVCLEHLVQFLQRKKKEDEEARAKQEREMEERKNEEAIKGKVEEKIGNAETAQTSEQ